MKISQLFKSSAKILDESLDEHVTSVFTEELHSQCKLWVIRDENGFLILHHDNGSCIPVWSDRYKMLSFLEGKNDTSWRSMAVPVHLFFTVWWPEVRHLTKGVGINWCGKGSQECIVSGEEFERLAGR